jgi:hypothetical protein
MEDYLARLIDCLTPVIGDYASVSTVENASGTRVLLTVHSDGEQFEFAESADEIVQHVTAYDNPPLWDPAVDNEEDGQWRLFAAHVKEAVETANDDQRILVLDRFGLVSRHKK